MSPEWLQKMTDMIFINTAKSVLNMFSFATKNSGIQKEHLFYSRNC